MIKPSLKMLEIKILRLLINRNRNALNYLTRTLSPFQGYTKPREYIVTEWPLRHTCGEFWSLVYDYECAAVVVLCVPPQGSTNFPTFWPEGRHSKKYGPVFTIDHISHNHYTNIKTWVY